MCTSKAFKAKLYEDFLMSTKTSTSSRVKYLNWFMPIGVMVDLFECVPTICKTLILFVLKDISNKVFDSLMDQGWHEKVVVGYDVIKCLVDQTSVLFKYHIGQSTL